MLIATRILRVLKEGARAKRVLLGMARSHHCKEAEFLAVFEEPLATGAIQKIGGRKNAVYGLPEKPEVLA